MRKLRYYLHRFDVQVFSFFLATVLIIVTFIGVLIYYSVSELLINEAVATTQNVLKMSSMNIETYLNKIKGESSILSENLSLRSYLQGDTAQKENVEQQISSMLAHDAYIKSVIIVSKNGDIISNEKDIGMITSSDMMKEDWYKKAIHNTMPVLIGARTQSFSEDMKDVISISTEVRDAKRKNLGVILMDLDYHVMEHFLTSINMEHGGDIFIINKDRQLVYDKDPSVLQDKKKQQRLLKLLRGGNRYNKRDNLLIHQTPIKNTDWTLVGVLPMDSLTVLKRQLMEHVIIIIISLSAAFLLIGSYFLRRLSSPMKKLQKGMLEIEKLSEIQIPEKSYYEVEVFTKNYNQMIHKIRELMNNLSEHEQKLKEAEISALISQINPHFLYNTLDTIIWMAEFNDYKKVISLTKSLASFFRLSLANGKEIITIQDELAHVTQYMFIQQERYGDKLSFTIDVTEDIKGYMIPKITLQPLVENSIYHGIRQSLKKGLIQISSMTDGEDIYISISDNGVGFTCGQSEENKVKLGGVGLSNVEQRLKLYYGEECGLSIESEPRKGCTVTIHIKKELKNKQV